MCYNTAMKSPNVYLISRPKIDFEELDDFLSDLGLLEGEWVSNANTDAELLIEFMGRLCYRSFGTRLNRNLTKIRQDNRGYISNLINSGHTSVLEHANCSFVFYPVSRVFTHELVRHRVGTAISQESLRYTRLDEQLTVIYPPCVNEEVAAELRKLSDQLGTSLQALEELMGLNDEGLDFHTKKQLTSFVRRFAPQGLATMVGWSSNFRTLLHVIPLRTSEGAEWEIRHVFNLVAEKMIEEYPAVFGRLKKHGDEFPYAYTLE